MRNKVKLLGFPLLVWFAGLILLIALLRVTEHDFGFQEILRLFFVVLTLAVIVRCHGRGCSTSQVWVMLLIFSCVCSFSYWTLYVYSEWASFSGLGQLPFVLISYVWPLAFSLIVSSGAAVVWFLATRLLLRFWQSGSTR